MFYNQQLIDALSHEVHVFDNEMILDPYFQKMVTGIYHGKFNKSKDGYKRSLAQVTANTLQGKMCELGCYELCGIEYEWNNFNEADRDSYAVDLSAFGLNIEIKSVKPFYKEFYIPKRAHQTLQNNIKEKKITTIVVCDYEQEDHDWGIRPRWIVNPKTFDDYLKQSNYDSWAYDIKKSKHAGDTIELDY